MTSKKEKILDTASQLFSRNGAKKTTIDEIAAEAGIAKGTVYLSFSSKEDILLAVGRREVDLILAQLRRVVRSETTAISKLEKFLITRFGAEDEIRKKYHSSPEAMQESYALPQSEKVKQEFYAGELHIIRDILEFGIESGEFRKIKNPDKISRTLSHLMKSLELRWDINEGDNLSVEDKVELFLDLAVNGLAPRK